jgi:transposase
LLNNPVEPQITLLISSTQAAARCPGCHAPARHVHRHDTRTRADLPWSGYGITWRLRVHKFFCRHPPCPRHIFTERLPGLAAPWARRTEVLERAKAQGQEFTPEDIAHISPLAYRHVIVNGTYDFSPPHTSNIQH